MFLKLLCDCRAVSKGKHDSLVGVNSHMVYHRIPGGFLESHTYDDLGRVKTDSQEGSVYAYDANGNISSVVYESGVKEVTYVYNAGNAMTSSTTELASTTDIETIYYIYDDNGNLLCKDRWVNDAAGQEGYETFDYNLRGQLVSYTDPNHETTAYEYNANGLRDGKTLDDESKI